MMNKSVRKIDLEIARGNYLRQTYFKFFRDDSCKGKMPYPTHEVMVGEDKCLVYDIPDDKKQEALDKANPLKGIITYPVGKSKSVPLAIEHKKVAFKNAVIIYYKRYNFIVPPMFFKDGTIEIGWGIIQKKSQTSKL